jgi:hypothetical protein
MKTVMPGRGLVGSGETLLKRIFAHLFEGLSDMEYVSIEVYTGEETLILQDVTV